MKMVDKELLEAIGQMMDAKLEPITARLDAMQEDIAAMQEDIAVIKDDLAELKEAHEITRDGVNTLLDWADNVAIEVKIPLKPAQ